MTTKEKVLNILLNNNNSQISGEMLAEKCGVSRAAIWKAINTLRGDGFQIEGTTNGGYIVKNEVDAFNKELFTQYFYSSFPSFTNSNIECFSEIDSTNTYAKRLLASNGSFRDSKGELTPFGLKYNNSIIIAESQTEGRGRLGRTFYSPKKTGIYLSIIYSPKGGITEPSRLTAFSAVAVKRAIKKLYNIDAKIKWINDIFVNNKKVCGILTEGFTNFETGTIEAAIIGIGINIEDNEEFFPKELQNVAGGILKTSDNKVGRCKLGAQVAGEVLQVLNEDPEKVMDEYKEGSFIIGKVVEIHPVIGDDSKNYNAQVIDIDHKASLVVKMENGEIKTLSSGEISLTSSSFTKLN